MLGKVANIQNELCKIRMLKKKEYSKAFILLFTVTFINAISYQKAMAMGLCWSKFV